MSHRRTVPLLAILAAALGAALAFAQTAPTPALVTVTATVAGYAGGRVTAVLAPAAAGVPGTVSGTLNADGTFTLKVTDTATLVPAGAQWSFYVCSAPGMFGNPTCYPQTLAVSCINNPACTNGTLDLTQQFSLAPQPPAVSAGTPITFEATFASSDPAAQVIQPSAFTTIALDTVTSDDAHGWDAKANTYTVPLPGKYLIVSKIRVADGAGGGDIGQGVNTENIDGPWFVWQQINGFRNMIVNTRVVTLPQGAKLRLYMYSDSAPQSIDEADLSIVSLH